MPAKVRPIAIVTCDDDVVMGSWCLAEIKALGDALMERNLDFTKVVWDDQNACWEDYSAIVVMQTYDYFKKAKEFQKWVEERRSIGNPQMWNSPAIVLWNMHKQYLEYFRENIVNVPEIVFCEKRSAAPDLNEVLKRRGWCRAVIKPAVGCGGFRVFRVEITDARIKQAQFEEYLQDGDMIIQQYVPEITSNGEYSLIYFDNVFSHAVIKFPAEGDFCTSQCLGGRLEIKPIDPPNNVLKMADEVVSLLKEDLLVSTRVDVIELDSGEVTLMEVEVIEPILHFARHEGSASKFVDALMRKIGIKESSLNG